MAEKYNTRIVEFLEQVAVEPEQFQVPDRYGAGTEAKQAQLMLYGGERFKFTNNSNDQDRIIVSQTDACSNLDYRRFRKTIRSWILNLLT